MFAKNISLNVLFKGCEEELRTTCLGRYLQAIVLENIEVNLQSALLGIDKLYLEQAIKLDCKRLQYCGVPDYEDPVSYCSTLKFENTLSIEDVFGISAAQLRTIEKASSDSVSGICWKEAENINKLFNDNLIKRAIQDPYLRGVVISQYLYSGEHLESCDKDMDFWCFIAKLCTKYLGKISPKTVNNISETNKKELRIDIYMYFDYLNMRENINRTYNKWLKGQGCQEIYLPVCFKPSLLKEYHDIAVREQRKWRMLSPSEKNSIFDTSISTLSEKDKYKKYLYSGKNYSVVPVLSSIDLIKEGNALNHCVATYTEAMAKEETFIYFLRKNKDISTPFYTMEIIPGKHPYLRQCYGSYNTTDKPADCRTFIKEWAERSHLDVECAI